jgi:hypothetical protein
MVKRTGNEIIGKKQITVYKTSVGNPPDRKPTGRLSVDLGILLKLFI